MTGARPPIVDVAARRQAAEALRAFLGGRLTNDGFENAEPRTKDPAISAIWSTAWALYSDRREHALTGADAPHPAERREMLRWILFLDGKLPYVWPLRDCPGFAHRSASYPRWYLPGSRIAAARARAFFAAGDFVVWPFARRSDWKRALRSPRRLAGRQGGRR